MPTIRLRDLLRRAPHAPEPSQPLRVLGEDIRTRVLADYHADTTRKAREQIIDLVRSGYHIGPTPYGYRTARAAGPATGRRVPTRLVPDPRTAPVVPAIFSLRLDEGLSAERIAMRLAEDPALFPPPVHPATGRPRAWTAGFVLAVLRHPVYTGRAVWGRTRNGRRMPREQWITSTPGAHRALIDERTFALTLATFPSHRRAA